MARQLARTRSAPIDADDANEADEPATTTRSRAKRGSAESAPAGRTRSGGSGGPARGGSVVESGWGAYSALRKSKSKFNKADEFKISEFYPEKYLIKFLQGVPFSVYGQHFFRDRPGKKAFICCEDCPLCAINADVTIYTVFNVLDLNGAEPVVKYWRATPAPADKILEFGEEFPIDDPERYALVYKKRADFNTFHVTEIQASRLAEKENVEPFPEDELAEFMDKLFTKEDVVEFSTYKELANLATEITGADD